MPHEGKTARGRVYTRKTLAERFWMKVDQDGPVVRPELGPCWLWTGSVLTGPGYGCIRDEDGKTITAHLASWMIHDRERPEPGIELCHRCDVRTCVNIDHLFSGTHHENMADAVSKGRMVQQYAPERLARGSAHRQAKLTEDQVREIRALAANGQSLRSIAASFGVSDTMVGYIVRRRFWRHVK